jgi:hypothetical protein
MLARLERLAPLAGALAGVLWLVGILVLQSANPADPDAAEELVAYFRDERTSILAGACWSGSASSSSSGSSPRCRSAWPAGSRPRP